MNELRELKQVFLLKLDTQVERTLKYRKFVEVKFILMHALAIKIDQVKFESIFVVYWRRPHYLSVNVLNW
jgi:hypothetical protein